MVEEAAALLRTEETTAELASVVKLRAEMLLAEMELRAEMPSPGQ